ncbi:MAG: hypothetical protein Q9221_005916 [Calogaya cf. arnoldii]
MFASLALTALVATTSVSATKLYVSSYDGNITTFDFTKTANASYNLALIDKNPDCAPNPSWLQLDLKNRNLFCLNENFASTTNGSLVSFKLAEEGKTSPSLKKITNSTIPAAAPVHSALYNGKNGTQLLAVAHYINALSTYTITPSTAQFTLSQHFNFTGPAGPVPIRQAVPRPHQIIIDPMKKYIVVPDLGSDIIRIFYINPTTLQLSERPSIPVPKGAGPRHGVFHLTPRATKSRGATHFYLLTEISAQILSFDVAYLPNNGGMTFTPIGKAVWAYGSGAGLDPIVAKGLAPAEITVGYLRNGATQLIVSNRNATFFSNVKNPDPKNSTAIVSDSLATFSLTSPSKMAANSTASIGEGKLTPAGGLYPRSFSISPNGDMIAIGLQTSGRVAVFHRCMDTGAIGKEAVAAYEGLGEVSSVVWGI